MALLELAELFEIPTHRLVPRIPRVGFFYSRPGIVERNFSSRRNIGKSIIDNVEMLCRNVRHMIVASIDTPFHKVTHYDFAKIGLISQSRRRRRHWRR